MKKLKFLTIFNLLIICNINTTHNDSIKLFNPYTVINNDTNYKQLISTIKNTPMPSQETIVAWLDNAFKNEHQDIILYILSNTNINPNTQDYYGNTLLHKAVLFDYPEIVEMLLLKGATPNKQNIYGDTPLHWVMNYNKNKNIINKLILAGANPYLFNNNGDRPIDLYHSEPLRCYS